MSFKEEFIAGTFQFFRLIVPEPQNRLPLTPSIVPFAFISYLPFVFLAYLARKPNTYLIRLLLLPTVIIAMIAMAYRYYWTIPSLNVYNWGQSLFAGVAIAKALEYGLTPRGMLKVGESEPNVLKGKGKEKKVFVNGHALNGNGNGNANGVVTPSYIAPWFSEAIKLAHTMRGIGWEFSKGTHIPPPTRSLERTPFITSTLISFIKNFLLLDLLESTIKLFPGVGTPLGGTMFYPSLPPFQRYFISTLIHMLTGSALLAGFQMVYDLCTFIAVYLFNDNPSSWPPVMDHPWTAGSMHEFWSKRWHQLLKRTFVVYGGIPGYCIAGKWGAVFGTFVASGLYHECAMYTMGRGLDPVVPLFFLIQGPLLVLERVWRKISGRRVGGWIGRLWVYFVMFVLAQPMINSWHRRGLGGGMVIPPFISPAKFLLPIVVRFVQSYILSS